MLSSAIEKAQMKIENNNYGIRKNLLEYDQVNNEQREIIYAERRRVLDGENMRDLHLKDDHRYRGELPWICPLSDEQDPEDWDLTGAERDFCSRSFRLKPIHGRESSG